MHCESLTPYFFFQIHFLKNVIVPQELRQIQSPPLTSVKKLNYSVRTDSWDFSVANVRARSSRFSIANVLDGLLWTSPHAEMVSIEHGHLHKFSFQVLNCFHLIQDLIYNLRMK